MKYSKKEEKQMEALFAAAKPASEIATELGRTEKSVAAKLNRLGLYYRGEYNTYPNEVLRKAFALRLTGLEWKKIHAKLGLEGHHNTILLQVARAVHRAPKRRANLAELREIEAALREDRQEAQAQMDGEEIDGWKLVQNFKNRTQKEAPWRAQQTIEGTRYTIYVGADPTLATKKIGEWLMKNLKLVEDRDSLYVYGPCTEEQAWDFLLHKGYALDLLEYVDREQHVEQVGGWTTRIVFHRK